MPNFDTKDEALDAMELTQPEWLAKARKYALNVVPRHYETITVDMIRDKVGPPPSSADPRIMGAVLRAPDWVRVGYTNSDRKTCHKRSIAVFARAAA